MIDRFLCAVLMGLIGSSAFAAGANDVQRGRIAFLRCAACHAIQADEPGKVGPNLRGTLGKVAAQVPGFAYSEALRKAGLTWDDATLKRWVHDPASLVPGTSMTYVNTLTETETKALLAFLKSQTTAR
jgi:cytochrome c